MTSQEFNEKYKDYLEKGHYGLDINESYIIDYLDKLFPSLIKFPNFKYQQIKWKFGYARFYSTLGVHLGLLIEEKLNNLQKEYNARQAETDRSKGEITK